MKTWYRFVIIVSLILVITSWSPAQKKISGKTETGWGLHTATFETPNGRIIVHLPDDVCPGDTISGSVSVDPVGRSERELMKNSNKLRGYVVEAENNTTPVIGGKIKWTLPVDITGGAIYLLLKDKEGKEIARTEVSFLSPSAPPSGDFLLPTIGQTGKPAQITGPFDGDSINTSAKFGENDVQVLAESPRKLVVESPIDTVGPTEIEIKEGNQSAKGEYRNVGISLSAPKTNLLRGERTTLTIEMSGLLGLEKELSVLLENRSPSIVGMEGGNTQIIAVQPSDIKSDGTYNTTRDLVGAVRGGFFITGFLPEIETSAKTQEESEAIIDEFIAKYIREHPDEPISTVKLEKLRRKAMEERGTSVQEQSVQPSLTEAERRAIEAMSNQIKYEEKTRELDKCKDRIRELSEKIEELEREKSIESKQCREEIEALLKEIEELEIQIVALKSSPGPFGFPVDRTTVSGPDYFYKWDHIHGTSPEAGEEVASSEGAIRIFFSRNCVILKIAQSDMYPRFTNDYKRLRDAVSNNASSVTLEDHGVIEGRGAIKQLELQYRLLEQITIYGPGSGSEFEHKYCYDNEDLMDNTLQDRIWQIINYQPPADVIEKECSKRKNPAEQRTIVLDHSFSLVRSEGSQTTEPKQEWKGRSSMETASSVEERSESTDLLVSHLWEVDCRTRKTVRNEVILTYATQQTDENGKVKEVFITRQWTPVLFYGNQ